jgi:hypothetical protein
VAGPKKPIRTPAERSAFLVECRLVRGRLDGLASSLPRTTGLTLDTPGRFARLRDLAAADVARLAREADETPRDAWAPAVPRAHLAGDGRRLTRAEWTDLGERVRGVRAEMRRLNLVEARAGASVKGRPFHRALAEFQLPLFLLAHALRQQHPSWAESHAVFYRPEPAARRVRVRPAPGGMKGR